MCTAPQKQDKLKGRALDGNGCRVRWLTGLCEGPTANQERGPPQRPGGHLPRQERAGRVYGSGWGKGPQPAPGERRVGGHNRNAPTREHEGRTNYRVGAAPDARLLAKISRRAGMPIMLNWLAPSVEHRTPSSENGGQTIQHNDAFQLGGRFLAKNVAGGVCPSG